MDDQQMGQQLAKPLYAKALELARDRAAEWRASEREAGDELALIAGIPQVEGTEALRAARDQLADDLVGELEGNAEALLAHRLVQLALAPRHSHRRRRDDGADPGPPTRAPGV
ncbi:MAG: hypothetical protein ABR529_05075 [Actinomycetota bacterium]